MTAPDISARAKEIERQFRSMGKPTDFDLRQERRNTRDAHVLTGVPQNVLMEWETIAGLRCIRMRPGTARPDRGIVFLHGGAYCLMSAMTHHRFGGHIANATSSEVIVPDYSLAPEAPFPAARDECLAVVAERRAHGPETLVLAGDSAGGGLALSVTCAIRDRGADLPDALVLMSPWLDLTLSGDRIRAGMIEDPILSLRNLTAMADLYRGERSASDVQVSPLFANLHGLPPTLAQSAEYDLLREDVERLVELWPKDGTLEIQRHAGMLHSFQMFAGDMPEADRAIADISKFLEMLETEG